MLARTVELAARIVGSPRTLGLAPGLRGRGISSRAPGTATRGKRSSRIGQLRFGAGRRATRSRSTTRSGVDGDKVAPTLAGVTFAVAPIQLDGGRLGCIVAELPAPEEIGEQRMRLLAGIAHQAKLAIANAGNFESLETTFLSTVEALANALEANDEYTSSHARWITDMALRVGEELGLDGALAEAARAGRALPRHRQDRRAREHPLQARPADERGARDHRAAPGARRADPGADRPARRRARDRARLPRALGRRRLSRPPLRRGDPARGPDHPRLRRLPRDDDRPALPQAAPGRGGAAAAARRRPAPSSTRRSSRRSCASTRHSALRA